MKKTPNYPSLDQLFHRAVTYPGPSHRLDGLATALHVVEEQLAHARVQEEKRLRTKLRSHLHPDDVELEKESFSQTVDQLLPKIFLGGFVISLWSVFEACVKDLAEYTKQTRNFPFGLDELRSGDFLKQMEMFFHGVIVLEAFPDKQVRSKIKELKDLRNALAHHDGSTSKLPESLRAKHSNQYDALGLQVYRDLHHEYAIPNADYVRRSLMLVKTYLESLSQRLYEALHPGGWTGGKT